MLTRRTALVCVLTLASHSATAQTQTFSSGSTGIHGPLNVTTLGNVIDVHAGGVYHHTTINITGAVSFARGPDNAPVVLLATGDVTIAAGATLSVSGRDGLGPNASTTGATIGGAGGPGGFNGGNGGFVGNPPSAQGPPAAGHGPAGGAPAAGTTMAHGGTYGAPAAFVALTPLVGGSGGGGGRATTTGAVSGGSGGGGGGAIVIASSTRIIVNGVVRANGGNSIFNSVECANFASAGSGGAVRLVAPQITGTGTVQAVAGIVNTFATCLPGVAQPGNGKVRLEAFAPLGFSGVTAPVASVATAPGAVSPGGNPALGNVPTLAITSIADSPAPLAKSASYFTPDLALPLGTTNPVEVKLAATNTPVGAPTAISVRVVPQSPGTATSVNATSHTGSFTNSTASASVTLPVGQVSVVQGIATMTLTGQSARLFPLIDGEPVERVQVAAMPGQASTLSLLTRSGKEVRVEQLPIEDQMRVAQAWQALTDRRTE